MEWAFQSSKLLVQQQTCTVSQLKKIKPICFHLYISKAKGKTHTTVQIWHALSRITLFYLPLTRLSTNAVNHAFASPDEAGPHFTDPEGTEG